MDVIGKPLRIPELDIKPEPTGGIQISKDMQQVLSTLTGFWRNKRLLLKASPSGILFTCSPQLEDIFHVTGSGANDTYQGDDIPCSEILIMGHPSNASKVWVRKGSEATVNNAWPLDANDVVNLSVINLNMLHLLIVADGEKAIIAYSM